MTRQNQSSLTFQGRTSSVWKQQRVSITATLGNSEVEDTIQLIGAPEPVLRVPQRQVAKVGAPLSYSVTAVDPHDLPVRVEAEGIPAGASFDAAAGVFQWSPTEFQTGQYRITFTATNSAHQSSKAQVLLDVDSGRPVVTATPLPCSAGAVGTLSGKWLGASGSPLSDPSGESFVLGGTSVAINGTTIPVLYSSEDRVHFLCPTSATVSETQFSVEVTSDFGSSEPVTMGMAEASPQLLSTNGSAQGQGLISFSGTNELVMDRNFSVASHPAQPGDQIVILATGLGSALGLAADTMVVHLGDVPVGVTSVEAVPRGAGVFAIHVSVPPAMAFGTERVQLQMTGADGRQFTSNGVTAVFEAARY
jgi:uncharacterized protein (TIGR03437 family)